VSIVSNWECHVQPEMCYKVLQGPLTNNFGMLGRASRVCVSEVDLYQVICSSSGAIHAKPETPSEILP
jgi:hypothetical protein